jgi:hypothetical protein
MTSIDGISNMRTILAALAVLLRLGMLDGTAKADKAAAPVDSHDQVPTGTWSATVVVDGTQFPTATMSFTGDGTLSITTPVSSATGVWRKRDGTGFEYQAKETYKPEPGLPGYVLIDQRAVIDGDTFTSSGESQVYDQDGNFSKTVHTVVTGTLPSSAPITRDKG